ncbi:Uncharacterised protein [Vibrio cholerae]|nr:Uncharacterised protein [Vibrio cholerae]
MPLYLAFTHSDFSSLGFHRPRSALRFPRGLACLIRQGAQKLQLLIR